LVFFRKIFRLKIFFTPQRNQCNFLKKITLTKKINATKKDTLKLIYTMTYKLTYTKTQTTKASISMFTRE